ncbi:LacI family DNA-binding transcriptional regulator [uncultured Streptomyces sp.]|uniref:LacI family DNA-binding transcriptional regulator n=1 Tax=uncultured Streptomyces sp. TaxID=174707 RepID=UPI002622B40A|nr:LacI family DNA-binding transcriptional regulator [uncultured Streptomyces sp.]
MSQLPQQPTPAPVPTSADVARLAGVSRATVSYVLNNNTTMRISEATRRRVKEAARDLGYVPHAAARSLRAGRTRTVLLPVGAVPEAPPHQQVVSELQAGLRRLDYTVVQYGSGGLAPDEAARAWAELRPVAVVVPPALSLTPYGRAVLTRSGARAVITLGAQPVDGAHALVMDQREVGACAVRHLLARGCRRIGVVAPADTVMAPSAAPRLEGARRAAERAGAHVEPLPLRYDEDDAAELARHWRRRALDAVFTCNDEYAMLLLRAFQDAGVEVPGEVALVGADDLMLGRLLRPRLTTVRAEIAPAQPLAELIDALVTRPGGPPEHHDLLRARVVPRESG